MIQFENVSKKHPNPDTEVVKNINPTIPTGQIAVVIVLPDAVKLHV